MEQVHGTGVIVIRPAARAEEPPAPPTGVGAVFAGDGDALVAEGPTSMLAVLTADCASVALGSDEGVFGAVHAGWRGLTAGVIEGAVATMRELGATRVVGALGPCIHPECYEFSPDDLDQVVAACGDGARGRTTDGRPALDIPAAVSAALLGAGATPVAGVDACTACGDGYFSHRARGDRGRQALVVWSTGPGGGL
jgi:copper oxidase (laccase) domain-containing protein